MEVSVFLPDQPHCLRRRVSIMRVAHNIELPGRDATGITQKVEEAAGINAEYHSRSFKLKR